LSHKRVISILRHLSRVQDTDSQGLGRLALGLRLSLLSLGLVLLALLATAASLEPRASGLGTHEQLGLPPCTFYTWYRRRCPSCGMTTAWSHAVRGQIPAALRANVGGTLLAALAVAAAGWSLLSALGGRWLPGRPSDTLLVAASAVIVGVTLIDWAWRLRAG
jgi:hypothetical protein